MRIVSGIYVIRNKVNDKVYIGSSQDIHKRFGSHRGDLKRGNHRNDHLQKAWNKYGEKYFEFKILERCNVEILIEREQHYLDVTDKKVVYNISRHADSAMRGLHHSDETKALLSEKGKQRVVSAETKIRISQTERGRIMSPETKALMSIAQSNRSPEHQARLAQSRKGKCNPPEAIAKMAYALAREYIITAPNGNEYQIRNLKQFCREHGLNDGHMCQVAKHAKSHYKGWKCEKVV